MNKITFGLLTGLLLAPTVSHAGFVALYDDSFSLRMNGFPLSFGVYETRWGSFNAGSFTPYLGNEQTPENEGYIDPTAPELIAILSQTNNFAMPPGGQMALALTILNDNSNFAFSSNVNTIILLDPSWVIPSFTFILPELTFSFTAQTHVAYLAGQSTATSYGFNGGNDIINISTVPEPSACAVFGGLGVLGFAAFRRRGFRA